MLAQTGSGDHWGFLFNRVFAADIIEYLEMTAKGNWCYRKKIDLTLLWVGGLGVGGFSHC